MGVITGPVQCGRGGFDVFAFLSRTIFRGEASRSTARRLVRLFNTVYDRQLIRSATRVIEASDQHITSGLSSR